MAITRRYSSVGPAALFRRVKKEYDAVSIAASEVLHAKGASAKKLQVWFLLKVKVQEVPLHGPLKEVGRQFDAGEFADSEVKENTLEIKRRYDEFLTLVKFLRKEYPNSNIPPLFRKACTKLDKPFVKSQLEWPGSLCKSAMSHVGEGNEKYTSYAIETPTERDVRMWFAAMCGISGIQDNEGFQHFLKDDDARYIEWHKHHSCCSIV